MSDEKNISENDILEVCFVPNNYICQIIVVCEKKFYNGKEMIDFYMYDNKIYYSAIQIMQFINPNLSETAINKMIRKKFIKNDDYIETTDKKKIILSDCCIIKIMYNYKTKVSDGFQTILIKLLASKNIHIKYKQNRL